MTKPPKSSVKVPLFQDEFGHWRFYGIQRIRHDLSDRSSWYTYDEMTGTMKHYGGFNTLWYADHNPRLPNDQTIFWKSYTLNSRIVYLPFMLNYELIWLENPPVN